MNELNELYEAINELKDVWGLLASFLPFIIGFVFTYVVEFKLLRKIDFLWDKDYKIQKAKNLGQVVTATLKSREVEYVSRDDYKSAKYTYVLNGRKRSKVIIFGSQQNTGCTARYPKEIMIYYLGNRIYTDYDKPSIINLLMCILMFLGAGSVAMTLQGFISLKPLLLISPEITDLLPSIRPWGIGVAIFLAVCMLFCIIFRPKNRKEKVTFDNNNSMDSN